MPPGATQLSNQRFSVVTQYGWWAANNRSSAKRFTSSPLVLQNELNYLYELKCYSGNVEIIMDSNPSNNKDKFICHSLK